MFIAFLFVVIACIAIVAQGNIEGLSKNVQNNIHTAEAKISEVLGEVKHTIVAGAAKGEAAAEAFRDSVQAHAESGMDSLASGAEKVKEKAHDLADHASVEADALRSAAKSFANEAAGSVSGHAEDIKNGAHNLAEKASALKNNAGEVLSAKLGDLNEKVHEIAADASSKAGAVKHSIQDMISENAKAASATLDEL